MDNNNINKELCELLINTGRELERKSTDPKQFVCAGHTFMVMNGDYHEVVEEDPIKPTTKNIFTLQGLVDFIKADVDKLFADPAKKYIVSILDPWKVEVVSPLCGIENTRNIIARCEYRPDSIQFNRYLDPDDFIVQMQSRFEDTPSRAIVLSVIGNMSDEQTGSTMDDGVTQKITVKKGVVTNGTTSFKNPAFLCPIRTFTEVEQPETPFVMRIKSGDSERKTGPGVALFECDGGAWQVEAVKNIREWLKKQLNGCNVEVIG